MNRRRQRTLSRIVPALSALVWMVNTGIAASQTPAQCEEDLAACIDNFQTCENDLWLAGRAVFNCNTEAGIVQEDLEGCQTSLSQAQADLATCTSDLAACQALAFPASGQTTAFTADKNDGIPGPVAVPEDGTVEAGADLSYTDNGDGTITDPRTGLMWEKKSDDGGLHDKDDIYWWSGNGDQRTVWDWLEAVNAEGGTGFAGYNDWRIPNVKELQSIVTYQSVPAVSAAFHNNCAAGATVLTGSCTFLHSHWSSSTRTDSPNTAWTVSFELGSVQPDSKSSTARVRAVRGGSH